MKLAGAGQKSSYSPSPPNQNIGITKSNDMLEDGVKSYMNSVGGVALASHIYQPTSPAFPYFQYGQYIPEMDKKSFKKDRSNSSLKNSTYMYDQSDTGSTLLQQHHNHLLQQSSATNQTPYFTPPNSYEN